MEQAPVWKYGKTNQSRKLANPQNLVEDNSFQNVDLWTCGRSLVDETAMSKAAVIYTT